MHPGRGRGGARDLGADPWRDAWGRDEDDDDDDDDEDEDDDDDDDDD
jgi:hypothetical protein